MDRRITTRALRTQGKEKTDINQLERQIQPNEKGRLIQSCIERIKIYITIKDLYLRFWKRFFFFLFPQVSFSWYCISREKETTYIELDCCCFLIIRFFTKRLLSSFHKAVSPLDLRIGMLVFQLPLGISKFFLILKLTPVWRNYTNSQHGCGPKEG